MRPYHCSLFALQLALQAEPLSCSVMRSHPCPESIYISSQQDIDEGSFANCDGPMANVIVTNASESVLDFQKKNNTSPISKIVIRDNSNLTSITFPTTYVPDGDIVQVEISGNPTLDAINASHLYKVNTVGHTTNLNISDLENASIYFPLSFPVNELVLYNSSVYIDYLTSIGYLKTSGTTFLELHVYEMETLEVEHAYNADLILLDLQEVQTAKWTNVSIGSCAIDPDETYAVLEDMVVGPSLFKSPPPILTTEHGTSSSMQFGGLGSIGRNLNVTQNNFVTLEFPVLEKISGELRIEDNKNCTLFFNKTTSIVSIYAANSPNTTLPGWFPELQEVGEIFLNGYIDPSLFSNVFPMLRTVNHSIRLEPWNSDFDCDSFLSRAKYLGYRSPSCNVTADDASGGSADDGPSGAESNAWRGRHIFAPGTDISQGQWAGIGTGIAVFLISCCFTIYFIVRLVALKKKLREQQGGQDTAGKSPAANGPDQEVAAKREDTAHEADSAQVVEAASREISPRPRELGNTVVVAEMWAPNNAIAELP